MIYEYLMMGPIHIKYIFFNAIMKFLFLQLHSFS